MSGRAESVCDAEGGCDRIGEMMVSHPGWIWRHSVVWFVNGSNKHTTEESRFTQAGGWLRI